VRDLVARSQPMCARCHNSITEIVDHIVPAGVAIAQARDSGKYVDKYAGFFIRSNLQGLCRVCHYNKTVEDKAHSSTWRDVVQHDASQTKKVWSF
jgi:5-methylcytosine-specific restriction endonuclease McrA